MGDSRGPYTDMDDLHVSVRTISTHYHKIKQFSHGRSPRAQLITLTSHHPQHGRSPCAQLILNLMSMHVQNMISIKGMMHLNQISI
uniref:Putative ovule protein n=1 Tax=Solanum chacoense TaxID=4108 RepID=A0A0V0HPU8_SOLCH